MLFKIQFNTLISLTKPNFSYRPMTFGSACNVIIFTLFCNNLIIMRSMRPRPSPSFCQAGSTATSQIPAQNTPSEIARPNPSNCPFLAQRVFFVCLIQITICVFSNAFKSFSGLRLGNPT